MDSNQTDFLMEFNDFSEVFDNVGLRICWGFIMMTELTFSNAFNFFFIMFDKYGEDSLKRSLNNQLISQGGFQLLDLIITELKSHMICQKSKASYWRKFCLSKKSFTRFALQSECCNFNQ